MLEKQFGELHPGDMYDAFYGIEREGMGLLGPLSAKWTASEEYARLSGILLKSTLIGEELRRGFFPFVPGWDPQMQARQLDTLERHMVEGWGTMLDLFSSKGRSSSREARLRTWREATTVPAMIAQTEKECIFESGIVRAYRYRRLDGKKPTKRIPLLLVFAIMNTPWVLDLHQGHSFVEHMLDEGYDVFLVDWGSPTPEERDWNFEDYALRFLPQIVDRVKELSSCDEVSILSWCLGAVISSIYAAMRPHEGLKNLILLTAPLDFSSGDIVFKRWLQHLDVEHLLELSGGIMPSALIELGAQSLKPIDNTLGTYLALWHHLDNPVFVESWRAMHRWLAMNVAMPGGAYRELVKSLYLGNALTGGEFATSEGLVNLRSVKADVFALIAKADHITPPVQTERAMERFGGEVTLERLDGGHIGVMVGGSAKKQAWPTINAWLAPRSS